MPVRKAQPEICTKLALASQLSVKNSHAESHENPANGLVIETVTDGQKDVVSPETFLLRKERLNCVFC
jgi:hypothetical protein